MATGPANRQTVMPQLRFTDEAATLAFYVGRLGFAVDWEHRFGEGFPLFAQVTRHGQSLFLTGHAGDCQPGGAVHLWVADVDACHRDFTARGLDLPPPQDTPWGTREMVAIDPDGNRLRFATDLDPEG